MSRLHLLPLTVLSFAALLLAGGFFLRSIGPARAEALGPVTTGGSWPGESFTGLIGSFENQLLLTVPADRMFIVTGVCTGNSTVDLYEGGTLRIDGNSWAMYCGDGDNGFLANGRGQLGFPPGSEVRITNTNSGTYAYALQGHYAAP